MNEIFSCIVLAAGNGKRMNSDLPKVLHKISAKPMVSILIDTLKEAGIKDIVAVTGYKEELVRLELGERVSYVTQKEQLGTGHAVIQAKEYFKAKKGRVLILCGDVPLIRNETLQSLMQMNERPEIDATVVSMELAEPAGYGRIIKDNTGRVVKIVEEKDATEEEKKVTEVNTGLYCFKIEDVFAALDEVTNNNKQKEYYLTDVIDILNKKKKNVRSLKLNDPFESTGINSRKDIYLAEKYLQKRIAEKIINSGVTIVSPDLVYIEEDVEVGKETIIEPFVRIGRGARIGTGCIIGSFVYIKESEIVGNNETRKN